MNIILYLRYPFEKNLEYFFSENCVLTVINNQFEKERFDIVSLLPISLDTLPLKKNL